LSFQENIGDSKITGDFSKLDKLVKNLGKDYYVDVGILGNEMTDEGITIAGIGAVHEFGTDKAGFWQNVEIPERSFIRMPLEEKSEEITKDVSKGYFEKITNGNIKGIFKDIGIAAERQIQEAFETGGFGTWAELTDSTIDAKGSDSILIDVGTLRKAITSKVGGGE
jgi:phage gpG-like protein